MNRCFLDLPAVCALAIASFCQTPTAARADLFALNSSGAIHRVSPATLDITRIYENPFGPVVPSLFTGLAFDGRILSWTRNVGFAYHELFQLDVVTEEWLPPTFVYDVLPPLAIVGLGSLGSESTGQLLAVASSQPQGIGVPAMLFLLEPFGGALPIGELPAEYQALGLDVDSATGEAWIAARHTVELRTDLLKISSSWLPPMQLGSVAATLAGEAQNVSAPTLIERIVSPSFPPGTGVPRGVGFDDGKMFVITGTRFLFDVDRATGEVLRSVQLPSTGIIGGLTGGAVVPEPCAAVLIIFAIGLIQRRRKPTSFLGSRH